MSLHLHDGDEQDENSEMLRLAAEQETDISWRGMSYADPSAFSSFDRTLVVLSPPRVTGSGQDGSLPQSIYRDSRASAAMNHPIPLVRKAFFELPLQIVPATRERQSSKPKNNNDFDDTTEDSSFGRLELARKSRLSVMSQVPLTNRLTGTLYATSVLRGQTGFSSSQVDLQYRFGGSSFLDESNQRRKINTNYNFFQGGVRLEEQPWVYLGCTKALGGKSSFSAHVSARPVSTRLLAAETGYSPPHLRQQHDALPWWHPIWKSTTSTLVGSHSFGDIVTVQFSCTLSPMQPTVRQTSRSTTSSAFMIPHHPLLLSCGLSLFSVSPNSNTKHASKTSNEPNHEVSPWHLGLVWTPASRQPLFLSASKTILFRSTVASKCFDKRLRLTGSWGAGDAWQLGCLLSRTSQLPTDSGKEQLRPQSVTTTTSVDESSNSTRTVGAGLVFLPALVRGRSSSGGQGIGEGLLTWVITLVLGDITLRIPIALTFAASAAQSKAADLAAKSAGSVLSSAAIDPFWYPIQVLYFTFLSNVLIDMVAHMLSPTPWGSSDRLMRRKTSSSSSSSSSSLRQRHTRSKRSNDPNGMDSDDNYNSSAIRVKQARDEALQQQALMERQANARTAAERERRGLVITKAVYYIPSITNQRKSGGGGGGGGGGSSSSSSTSTRSGSSARQGRTKRDKDGERLDVTIPIQFWVTESMLELSASSKSRLLGFYDISMTRAEEEKAVSTRTPKERNKTVDETTSTSTSWWRRVTKLWTSSRNVATDASLLEPSRVTPRLRIEYEYRGVAKSVTIGDRQALSLPTKAELEE